jgi:hypothetical protein
MDQSKLRKLAGMPVLAEGARPSKYEESADFDADYDELEAHLTAALKILKSPAWNEWMKATDHNYSTSAVEMSRRLEDKVTLAKEAATNFYSHMEQAS